MSRTANLLLIVWLLAVGSELMVPTHATAQSDDDIFFHDDYDKALREARRTKKPIFLEFRCEP